MRRDDFDFMGGDVVYWDMDALSDSMPLSEQEDSLKEDLAQISYGRLLLDVGWYYGAGQGGAFVVCVVVEGDWDSPVFSEECKGLVELRDRISEGARFAARASG